MRGNHSIGGEMEIFPSMFVGQGKGNVWPDFGKSLMLRCDTGRSALHLALQHWRAAHAGATGKVWLPEYVCHSILETVLHAGLPYAYYCDLPGATCLLTCPEPAACDLVVIVHYFGSINRAALNWLESAARSGFKVLEDCVQAPYSLLAGRSGDYVIVSMRKWWPVSDGAALYLNAEEFVAELLPTDEKFISRRMAAQLLRATGRGEDCYLRWIHDSEELLRYSLPRCCSWISQRLLAGIDVHRANQKRVANWRHFDSLLVGNEQQTFVVGRVFDALAEGEVPLVYPIRVDGRRRNQLRTWLAERRIYCPIHWRLDDVTSESSRTLSEEILSIPIDQRYGEPEMRRVAGALTDFKMVDRS